jgi:hypothetical protein
VQSEGLCQWQIPLTPSGIETATFRFVAQYLNQFATISGHPLTFAFIVDTVVCPLQHILQGGAAHRPNNMATPDLTSYI